MEKLFFFFAFSQVLMYQELSFASFKISFVFDFFVHHVFFFCIDFYLFFFFFWPHPKVHGILVPQPGIKPMPPAVEVQSLNSWTPREVPKVSFK